MAIVRVQFRNRSACIFQTLNGVYWQLNPSLVFTLDAYFRQFLFVSLIIRSGNRATRDTPGSNYFQTNVFSLFITTSSQTIGRTSSLTLTNITTLPIPVNNGILQKRQRLPTPSVFKHYGSTRPRLSSSFGSEVVIVGRILIDHNVVRKQNTRGIMAGSGTILQTMSKIVLGRETRYWMLIQAKSSVSLGRTRRERRGILTSWTIIWS